MPRSALEDVSRKLQKLYGTVLNAERRFAPSGAGLQLLDRLMNDPAWAWLRPLSSLIAEVDHALAQDAELSAMEGAAAAAHIRGLIFGEGDQLDAAFSTLHPGMSPEQDAQDEIAWAAAVPAPARVVTAAPAFAPIGAPASRPNALDSAAAERPVVLDSTAADRPVASVAQSAPVTAHAPAVASPGEATTKPVAPNAPVTAVASAPVAPKTTSANPFASLSAAKAEAAARLVAPAITDEVIEEVVTRVLQRLTDQVVRETVTSIVSQTAERLVQEEIDRIKNSGTGDPV